MKFDFHPNECVSPLTRIIAEDRDAAELFLRVGILPGDDYRELLRLGNEDDILFFRQGHSMSYEEAIQELEAQLAERAPQVTRLQEEARAKIARAEAAKQTRLASQGTTP
jgi:hypothetical protein